MILLATTVCTAYLLGCVNTGYYLVRLRTGADLRQLGSGTLGARNAGRALGTGGFVVVMAGDMLKGTAAVMLALLATGSTIAAGAALVAVVAGHMYPVQLRFHGGKGLATGAGALAPLAPVPLLLAAAAAGVVLAATRSTGAAAAGAALVLPLATWLHAPAPSAPLLASTLLLSALLLFRHRTGASALPAAPAGQA
jgi:acyl phosphate:glycerol-3-phosphate acyltransferase